MLLTRARISIPSKRIRSLSGSAMWMTRNHSWPFGGIADGGGFQQGIQTAKSDQTVAGIDARLFSQYGQRGARGFNHLHTTRFGPEGNHMGIPAQFGIQGIPQVAENGGLPTFDFRRSLRPWAAMISCRQTKSARPFSHRRLHQDLRQAQLQDGHRIPARQVLHAAARLVARQLRLQRPIHRYS